MTTPSELGRLIRRERKRQRLTQEMLAGLVGVGPRLIGEIENGKESAEIGKVFHVMAILGIDLIATPREAAPTRAPKPDRP
jgi:HTH-type transcriptional regulator/antitoxin HipB